MTPYKHHICGRNSGVEHQARDVLASRLDGASQAAADQVVLSGRADAP
jgi:hypothetical protein